MCQVRFPHLLNKSIHIIVIFFFTVMQGLPGSLPTAYAQAGAPLGISGLNLPAPGAMVQVSPDFVPPHLIGLKLYPDNPLRFDFVLDKGDDAAPQEDIQKESLKLINYFLAALTVPQNELWVNLSPYEENRIIPASFSVTEMGRDLLGQDYLLKQLTASLIHPDSETGKIFWKRINEMTGQAFDAQDVSVDTFHKIWIVPDKAVVYVKDDTAFIMESRLKVMLEEDYFAMQNNQLHVTSDKSRVISSSSLVTRHASPTKLQTDIMREVVLPVIEQEVNDGENFALLRQVYHSMILATWFKRNFKQSALGKVYADQNKVHGIDLEDKAAKEKIYKQYVETFEKGVFDFIREDVDEASGVAIPRRYFSGGFMGGKELDEAVTETRQPSRGFVESILKRMKGILLIGAALTALGGEDVAINTANAGQMDQGTTSVVLPLAKQQENYTRARKLLIDHMNFVLANDGIGIANHRNPVMWKSFIRNLIYRYEGYPRAATEMITNDDLLDAFLDLYMESFNVAMKQTENPYIDNAVNHRKMLELLKSTWTSPNAPTSSASAEDAPFRRFFQQEWSQFIIQVSKNDELEIKKAGQRLLNQARRLGPEVEAIVSKIVTVGTDFGDDAKQKELLREWRNFNESYLLPRNFYGELNIVTRLSDNSHFFVAVVYKVDRREDRTVNGKPIKVIYGRKIDQTNLLGATGHSIKEEQVVFVNADDVMEQVRHIQEILEYKSHYYLDADENVFHPLVDDWVRRTYTGMTEQEIRSSVEHDIRAHELTHKLQELKGVEYRLPDRVGVPKDFWNRLSEEDKRSIEHEVAAYLAEISLEDKKGATLTHLLPHLLGPPTAHSFAAYYIFNTLAGRAEGDWVDWRNANKALGVYFELMGDPKAAQEKAVLQYKKGFEGMGFVQPFRFPENIWKQFKQRLAGLEQGAEIQAYIAEYGLAWTAHDGVHFIDEDLEFKVRFGYGTVAHVWQAAVNALNAANGWDPSSKKYIHDSEQVKAVVHFHEGVHDSLRSQDLEQVKEAFRRELEESVNVGELTLTENHPLIRAFHEEYGGPSRRELAGSIDAIDWYVEEIFVLSLQEGLLFENFMEVFERLNKSPPVAEHQFNFERLGTFLNGVSQFVRADGSFDPTPDILPIESDAAMLSLNQVRNAALSVLPMALFSGYSPVTAAEIFQAFHMTGAQGPASFLSSERMEAADVEWAIKFYMRDCIRRDYSHELMDAVENYLRTKYLHLLESQDGEETAEYQARVAVARRVLRDALSREKDDKNVDITIERVIEGWFEDTLNDVWLRGGSARLTPSANKFTVLIEEIEAEEEIKVVFNGGSGENMNRASIPFMKDTQGNIYLIDLNHQPVALVSGKKLRINLKDMEEPSHDSESEAVELQVLLTVDGQLQFEWVNPPQTDRREKDAQGFFVEYMQDPQIAFMFNRFDTRQALQDYLIAQMNDRKVNDVVEWTLDDVLTAVYLDPADPAVRELVRLMLPTIELAGANLTLQFSNDRIELHKHARTVEPLQFDLKDNDSGLEPLIRIKTDEDSNDPGARESEPSEKDHGNDDQADPAMLNQNPGGIDMNPDLLNLDAQGQTINFNLPDDPAMLDAIDGFTPVIINILPADLPAMLGFPLSELEQSPGDSSPLARR